jgi:hypothetical protein
MNRRRLTRRQVLAAAAVAASGLATEQGARRGSAAPVLQITGYEFRAAFTGDGWGRDWAPLQYQDRISSSGGAGTFQVPTGLEGTATAQPMPVQLLDHDCAGCEQLVTFSVSDRTLRPGLMALGHGPFEFLGVTAEQGRLILAAYGREQRSVIADARAVPVGAGIAYHMRMLVDDEPGRLRATIWPETADEPEPQLDQPVAVTRGTPGYLLVHPESLHACTARVTFYAVRSARPFSPTPPALVAAISGIPSGPAAATRSIARVWSAYPAHISFEWSDDDAPADLVRMPARAVMEPPYTTSVRLPAGARPLRWRARLRSPTSGAELVTPLYEILPHDERQPLVMLAASCVQLTGVPPNAGFRRLLAAAPRRPAGLVFQGDAGYANNSHDSCYSEAEDYFADRFGRFMSDVDFAGLRRTVPTGFTADDHDYGHNNANKTTVEPWAIDLWNRIHADPTTLDYFDFRFGDVHALTLDGRRYADPVMEPNTERKTKLGFRQLDWMRRVMRESDAAMFVVFSADSFALRENLHPRPGRPALVLDCFQAGWPADYRRIISFFMDLQLEGRRVVILSGDAHGLRVHYHPDPLGRPTAARLSIVEMICAGLRPRSWAGAVPTDPSLDRRRYVVGHPGAGMIVIDPPEGRSRRVTLRAINGRANEPPDAFPPLRVSFTPGDDRAAGRA